MKRIQLWKTAAYMMAKGYSANSIKSLTGLTERRLLRWYLSLIKDNDNRKGGSGAPINCS